MEVTCAISGLKFSTSFFVRKSLAGEMGYFHPIFALQSPSSLLKNYYDLRQDSFGYTQNPEFLEENYLLLLSLLHTIRILEIQSPPTKIVQGLKQKDSPFVSCLISTLDKTIPIVLWLEKSKQYRHRIPHLSLNRQLSLQNISDYLDTVAEIKTQSLAGKTGITQRYQQDIEAELENVLCSSPAHAKIVAVKLAEWAGYVGAFPKSHKDMWVRMIRSCSSFLCEDISEYENLKSWVMDHIAADSFYFLQLIELINSKIRSHKGKLGYQILEGSEISTLGLSEKMQNAILDEQTVLQSLSAKIGLEEPQRKDFPNLAEYLKAKSIWLCKKEGE